MSDAEPGTTIPAGERPSPRRGMCAAVLSLEAITVALATPVMIAVEDVEVGVALAAGLGLAAACLVVCGLLRAEWGYVLGFAVQVAALALGFLVTTMFVLGAIFALLWTTAYWLGRRIEHDRAAYAAAREAGPEERHRVTDAPLSPTDRTRVRRGREHALSEREELLDFLAAGLVAHLGVVVGDHPVVLPVAYAVDPDGPDPEGTLYVHGSVAARWLRRAEHATVCVTVTEVDGIVAARSGFNHSMNYRSAVVIGAARIVDDPDEKARALTLTVDHVVPGRSATLRAHTRKELAATALLAIPLQEASMKRRSGDPVDEPEDVEAGVWAGVVPLRRVASAVVSSADSHDDVPPDVVRRAGDFA